MGILLACMCVHHMLGAYMGQKRELDPLGLELQ